MDKFELKDRLDKCLYGIYNMLSDSMFALNFTSKHLLRENRKYHQIHKNQKCFILGTGPSLKQLNGEQLALLKDEVIFGVNSLYKSEIGRSVRPKYYTLIDNLYWGEWSNTFNEVRAVYADQPPVVVSDLRARVKIENAGLDAIYISSKKYPTYRMSADLETNVYAAMNVVSYSILTAIYMGFSEVYLLGCDYNAFCTAGLGHCYDDKDELSQVNYNLAFYLKFYWITTEFHYLIAKLAKERNVKIINLTPGSLLDAYPREDMDDFFKRGCRDCK